MISTSASRRKRQLRQGYAAFRGRMNEQREVGRRRHRAAEAHQIEVDLTRREQALKAGKPLRGERGRFLPINPLKARLTAIRHKMR